MNNPRFFFFEDAGFVARRSLTLARTGGVGATPPPPEVFRG